MSTAAAVILLLLLERWIYGSITLFAIDSLTKVKIEQAIEMKNRNHHHHHHRLHHHHCRCRCRCRNRNYVNKWSRRTRGWRRWFFFPVFFNYAYWWRVFFVYVRNFFHPLWSSSLNVQFIVCKTKIKTKPKRWIETQKFNFAYVVWRHHYIHSKNFTGWR